MAQPTAYSKTTNFAQDESNNVGGRSTVRTSNVDAEFRNIETTLDETLRNLALIQRDDGQLRDGLVELYNLSLAARIALQSNMTPRGAWVTATAYVLNDLVESNDGVYVCLTAHLSGVFATDLSAGKWQLLSAQDRRFYASPLPADPATRPDGSAIQNGDWYFNSVSLVWKEYNGTAWFAYDLNQALLAASGGSALVGFLQSGTGAVARTAQDKMRDFVSVKDFGAVGDGVTDDLAAFNAAIAALPAASPHTSRVGKLVIPTGNYYLSGTLHIRKAVHLCGEGDGATGAGIFYPATLLTFAAGVDGINIYSLFDSGNGNSASYARVSNLTLESLSNGSGATGHGITTSARIFVHNVHVTKFAQNGINIVANVGTGNANLSELWNVNSIENGGKGFYIDGDNANACLIFKCSAESNVAEGFYDASTIGNTYVACHGSANKPSAAPNYVDFKTTVGGSPNIFVGCYTESGLNEVIYPSVVIGGILAGPNASVGAGNDANIWGGVGSGSPYKYHNYLSPTLEPYFSAGLHDSNNGIFKFGLNQTPFTFYNFEYNNASATKWFRYSLNGGLGIVQFPATTSIRVRGLLFEEGILFGDAVTNYALRWGTAPVAGTWVRGDWSANNTPSVGGFAAKVCTTAGTPGTWSQFGEIVGAGGTVTQATDKTTGVTLNTRTGEITLEPTASIAAGAVASFTLTSSVIAAADVIHVQRKSGGTAASYRVWCDSVAAGSCVICVENRTGGALAEAVVLSFRVLAGATS
jgi:hypothetical protein